MLLITTCFSTVTPESAEHGDVAESGILSQDEPTSFRDLVALLKYGEPSAWPASGDTREWVSQDQGETCAYFERGERTEHTFHFSQANPARKAKYWALAFKAAGLVKS
jgi:hypothetical protein